jgi:NTF2 fold immunity protein of polymorphic toxin system component
VSHRIGIGGMIAITLVVCTVLSPLGVRSQEHSYVSKDGFVPNEKTAIRIAEAVLDHVYGDDVINSERPFDAKLNDAGNTWIVWGHLRKPANKGGAAYIEISKADGRILRVTHGK